MRDAEPEAISPVRLADAFALLAAGPNRPSAGGTAATPSDTRVLH